MSRRAGFTLVELLLGLSLFSVIGLAAYGSLRSGLEAQRRVSERALEDQLVRGLLDLIAADLEAAFISGGALDSGFIGTNADEDELPRDSLSFVTARGRPDGSLPGEMDLLGVTYEIDVDDETPASGLVRNRRRILTAAATDADEVKADELAPEVEGLDFEYFDGSEWQQVWDSSASATLPQAVRVTIQFRPPGSDGQALDVSVDNLRAVSRTVRIPVTGPLRARTAEM